MAELKQPRAHIVDCLDGAEWDYYPVTAEANTLTLQGDRQAQYGHPLPWAVRFANTLNAVFGWGVQPEQVALLMILFKVCRQVGGKRQRDNYVDICGYAECGQRICEAEGQLAAVKCEQIVSEAHVANVEFFCQIADAARREDLDAVLALVRDC